MNKGDIGIKFFTQLLVYVYLTTHSKNRELLKEN